MGPRSACSCRHGGRSPLRPLVKPLREEDTPGGGKEVEIELPPRPSRLLRACTVAALGAGLLVAAAAAHATPAGTVVAWGCGLSAWGQCSPPSALDGHAVAISAGFAHSLALKDDGTVAAWGCLGGTDYGQCSVPPGLAGATAVAAGGVHSLALKGDGTVVAWGCGNGQSYGQCTVPTGLDGVTAIAAGTNHSLALKGDGTVVAWGCGSGQSYGQCTVPVGLAGVVAIAAAQEHSLALKSDGTVAAWGCSGINLFGQCGVPADLVGVTAIAASTDQSLALKGDGTMTGWGCGGGYDFGQCSIPAGLAGITAVAAGGIHDVALKNDGTVVAWGCGGGYDAVHCAVPGGLFGIGAVAAGAWHSLALVVPTGQTVTLAPLPNRTYGDPDFSVSATASSGLPVSIEADGTCVAFAQVVHLTGAGACTVKGAQAGNLNYNPAGSSQTFAIAKADQSIAFGPLPSRRYGAPDFRVFAFASSGLPVLFAARGSCTVTGATVHLTGVGSCTITASQAGDPNHKPASEVARTFAVERARCRVPNVVGKRLAAAKRTLAQRHCRTGRVGRAYSPRRKKGTVISQTPAPGRVLPAGSKIKLIVSRGRRR